MTLTKLVLSLALFILFSPATSANSSDADVAKQILRSADELPKVEDLNWLNQKFLTKQRKIVNDLTRTHYGRGLAGNKRDIALIQRIVDDNLIKPEDKEELQALGVALGDAYVNDVNELEWKIFTDEIGATHAVCVKNTKECIFVITMLSRRMELGIQPSVQKIYDKGINAIKKFLPKTPYAVD